MGTMNLLKISGFLLLLNILLVHSFELKVALYTNTDCSGSPVKETIRHVDNDNLECVETNKLKDGNEILINGTCVPVDVNFGRKSNGLHQFVELDAMRGLDFDRANASVKITWSGWCDGSLPGWAIALIVIAVLGLLGVGIYFMFCRKKQKPARSYLVPTRPQQQSSTGNPVAV